MAHDMCRDLPACCGLRAFARWESPRVPSSPQGLETCVILSFPRRENLLQIYFQLNMLTTHT